jgi:hypothetical protein
MKYTILFLLIFSAIPLLAQQPTISYLMCDEAKSQLQIRGSFGSDSGSVVIENIPLAILSWSDSLIICSLPTSGATSGGKVQVNSLKGVSNQKTLSVFNAEIVHYLYHYNHNPLYDAFFQDGVLVWNVSWRADIQDRDTTNSIVPFEASLISKGFVYPSFTYPSAPFLILPFADTAHLTDSCISFSGIIDLSHWKINFNPAKILLPSGIAASSDGGNIDANNFYLPLSIDFDTLGYLSGYIDSATDYFSYTKKTNILHYQSMTFPPATKNVVNISQSDISDCLDFERISRQLISFLLPPFGSTTASLYSIDGRLLKRTKLDISAAGEYSIDVRDVHTHFAFLVLQTGKGVITRKVILSEP